MVKMSTASPDTTELGLRRRHWLMGRDGCDNNRTVQLLWDSVSVLQDVIKIKVSPKGAEQASFEMQLQLCPEYGLGKKFSTIL